MDIFANFQNQINKQFSLIEYTGQYFFVENLTKNTIWKKINLKLTSVT